MSQIAQNSQRLVRTTFWTFLVITIGVTAYGFLVEAFGLGLFLRDNPVPKLHMRAEAHLAEALSSASALGLFVTSFIIRRWNRTLFGVGLAGCVFWFVYFALPRY
jgi:hypothetical protein